MATEQKIIAFLKKRATTWGPNPLAYVQQMGVEGLMAEFRADPELSQFCGWFNRPVDDQIIGGVEQFIREENPILGYVAAIVVRSLIDACAQCHEVNKAVAVENMKTGAGAVGIASLFVGLIMLLSQGEKD